MNAPNSKHNSEPTISTQGGYPMRALAVLTAAVLLVNYVQTMVLPGIPTIEKDLSTTVTIGSWIVSVVLLVGAAVSPILGKLGDLYGKKKLIVVSLGFYTIGVSIAGFANSICLLIFARAIQGVGLAILPLSLAWVTDIFPKDELTTAQGVIAGAAAISVALGLVLGAYVIQDFGWQFSFRTVAILSVILFVIVIAVLKRDVSSIKCKIDYVGAILLSVGVALVLLYITEGSTLGWFSTEQLIFLITGLALNVSFFYFETKTDEPLIPLNLLKIRNVLVANLVTIITGLITFLLFFAIIEYLELPAPYGLGFDVIATGLTLVPGTIVMFILGPIVGRILIKAGPKPIFVAGSSLSILGFVLLIVSRGTATDVTIGVIFGFAAIVSLLVPVVNTISLYLPKESVTVGQGFNLTIRNIGSALGPVITTTILATYTNQITRVIDGKQVVIATLPSTTAFNLVFAIGIALAVVVIVLSMAFKNGTFKNDNGNLGKETTV
jgi:MFS family permease